MNIQNHIFSLNNPYAVSAVDISPDGSQLLVGQDNNGSGSHPNLTLFSFPNLDTVAAIEQLGNVTIVSAIFTSNGNKLIYVTDPSEVTIYNLQTQTKSKFGLSAERVIWLAAAKTSPRILTAGKQIDIWDLEQPERYWIWGVPNYQIAEDERPALADISPDGTKVAVVGNNTNQALIYDIDQGEIIHLLEDAPFKAHWAKFSPDMRYFAAIGYYARGIYVWDLTTGKRHLAENIFSEDEIGCRSLSFHPSGRFMAVGTQGSMASIYRISDGEELVSLTYLDIGQIEGLMFTPDGKYLCAGGFKGAISIVDLQGLY